jgi:hypothetical protein
VNVLKKLSGAATLVGFSQYALADGYIITWGSQSVPISPWISVASGLLITVAAYSFLKRHASRGFFFLAISVVAGAMALYPEKQTLANIPQYPVSITGSSGSFTYTCGDVYNTDQTYRATITNNTTASVVISVTPTGNITSISGTCINGQTLPPTTSCYVQCDA